MATKNKIFLPNEVYFLTFTILDWKPIFTSDKYTNLIYKWFDYMKENYNNKIHGYVIMPNHVHVLLKVTNKSPKVPKLIQNAKRFLAYEIVKYLEEDNKKELLAHFRERARTNYRAKHKNTIRLAKPLQSLNRRLLRGHSSALNYILGKGGYDVDILEI